MTRSIPNGVINISSVDGFNQIVNTYKENLILVDFWADWCAPCKSFAPVYSKVQTEYFQKGVIFAKLDTDQLPSVAEQFGIQGIPTLVIIRNNKGLKKQVGAISGQKLRQLIDKYL